MKQSIFVGKLSIFLALLIGGNGLVAMESVIQLQPHKKWQYADTLFKFKCVDSVSDEDVIKVPGNLVHYSKQLTLMINDIGGDPTIIIPLFHTTKECFNRIIHALEILINPQETYKDLVAYYGSLSQSQLLECILHINYYDIQPLLLPALEVLQQALVQSSSDILTWKLGLPAEILAMLKNSALESLNAPVVMCNLVAQTTPKFFSATAFNQGGMAFGLWDTNIRIIDNTQTIFLRGHTGIVDALHFSPNNQKIASASGDDKTMRLWDIATQQEVAQFKNLNYPSFMQFSSDNNYFACLGNPEEVNEQNESYALINRKTGQMHMLPKVEGFINDVAVSPDGKQIAIAAGKLYLWNTQTQVLMPLEMEGGLPETEEESPELSIAKVAFSSDGKLLVSSSNPTELETVDIVVWNMVDNVSVCKITTGTVASEMVFSQDGTLLAFDDGEDVQVFDVQKDEPVIRMSGHTTHIHSIAFMPDNKHIITTAHDDVIRITNLSDGKERKLVEDGAEVIDDAYVVDDTTLATVSEEGSLYTWDIVTGQSKKLLTVSDATGVAALSPDKTLIAVNAKGGKINLLNIKTGELRLFIQGIGSLIDLQFSVDGQSLLACYANGTAWLRDIKTGISQKISGTTDKIITNAYCIGDGSLVLIKEKTKNFINLYDIQKNIPYQLTAHSNDVNGLVFSPDGHYLISSSEDSMINIWDVHTQQVVKRFNIKADSCTVSPDGNTLVASDDKHIYLINLSTNTQQILTTHINPEESFVNVMMFNADGSLLAIRKGNTIELWDMNTHTLMDSIKDPVSSISRYFFVPNTTLLVIVGEESVVFWDSYSNRPVLTYPLRCWTNAVNTNRDGSTIIVSGIVESQAEGNQQSQTAIVTLNQTLVKALATFSFEQIFIIARALYAMRIGTPLDLTNSPELLAIFNQINPEHRALIEACFKIKTTQ